MVRGICPDEELVTVVRKRLTPDRVQDGVDLDVVVQVARARRRRLEDRPTPR